MKNKGITCLIVVLLGLSAFTVNHWLVDEIKHSQNPQKSASEKVVAETFPTIISQPTGSLKNEPVSKANSIPNNWLIFIPLGLVLILAIPLFLISRPHS